MEKFIKTSSAKLSGLEKAAVLLAELGPAFNNNYAALEQALNLSEKEKIKLANAMKNLGSYNPVVHGIGEILREESVLNEVIEFGTLRGIFHPVEKNRTGNSRFDISNGVSDMAKQNPEAVAKILSSWLGNESREN